MEEYLKVGIVQCVVDSKLLWNNSCQMDLYEANAVWKQALSAFASFREMSETNRPDIIILPELAVSSLFESRLKQYAQSTGAIVIAGLDFNLLGDNKIENWALFYIPRDWPKSKNVGTVKSQSFYFGKRFPSQEEKNCFTLWGKTFSPCNTFYIVDLAEYGKMGISICADFYDIERYAIYKGRIQHLLIIANNKDVKSFYFLAEAMSRLVFCNVIICNSGLYGGSICFTLSKNDYDRYRYKHEGHELFTSQIVDLPVEALFKAQNGDENYKGMFKSCPPGYNYEYKDNA